MKSLLVLAALVLWAGLAHADPYAPPPFLATPPVLPAGYDAGSALRLDLAGAIQIAVQQNLTISLARRQVETGQLGVDGATATLYEPTVGASYSRNSSSSPPATRQAGAAGDTIASQSDGASVGITQHLPTGATVNVGLNYGRTNSTSGAAVLPVTYGTSLSFQISQPLFRGFSRDLVIPQYSILSAKIASESDRQQLSMATANVVQSTEQAYWEVVDAMYAYGVAVSSQHEAETTIELTRRQIAAGSIAPAELSAAESTLAQRQLAVLNAAAAIETDWDALRIVLALPRDQWSRPILPIDVPAFDTTPTPTFDDALAVAVAHRPEMTVMALEDKQAELGARKAENDRLPDISLTLGGQLFGQDASASAAFGELGAHDFSSWSVGVGLSWTPLDRANHVAERRQHVEREVRQTNHEAKVQGLWSEVRTAVRNQQAAALQVAAASHARALANDSLVVENKKYIAGSSSNLAIAQVQASLAGAELAELSALIGAERARTALLLATGRLLDARHIELK